MIAVEGVTKRYGPVVAVDELNFEVGRGEVVGFLGPNGAGKTTTMRMLSGTLQPDAGVVRFDGRSIGEMLTEAKRRVGYLPESNALYTDMLVSEYLDFTGRLREMDHDTRRRAVLDAVDRTAIREVFHRPISQLSKGYRQRVGLAAAILHRPEILILDEPTEGLDPNQRVDIRGLIRQLGEEHTVLLSTHVLGEVEATCDRLLIISRGRLVADGGVQDLLDRDRAGARYVVEVEGPGVTDALEKLDDVASTTSEPVDGRVRVTVMAKGSAELRPAISNLAAEHGWTLWELHRERGSLERLFHELTEEAPAPQAGVETESPPPSRSRAADVAAAEPGEDAESGGASPEGGEEVNR
jgi:ABC-2 type transport system ATP-binding protein